MSNRIITISRQFGSGGRTIGKESAAKLGIPCYDVELIEKIAEESGFTKAYVAERGEYAPHGGWLASAISDRDFYGHSNQDDLWSAQRKVILKLAEEGPCVIVGRCADYILRDVADCLTVFIHADMDKRAKRIVEQYGERDDTPEKRLKDKDKRRAAYYQFYTDMEWGAAQHYHVALDSGELGIEKCVDTLVALYHQGSGDQTCPCCGNHCSVEALKCPKGREHFGLGGGEKQDRRQGNRPPEPSTPEEKVIALLRKGGHYLHHNFGKGEQPDHAKLLSALSEEEKASLTTLLEKCVESW